MKLCHCSRTRLVRVLWFLEERGLVANQRAWFESLKGRPACRFATGA